MTNTVIKTTGSINTPVRIPNVTANATDPTDRYCDSNGELDGPDRRWSAYVALKNLVQFEEDTEAEEIESFNGNVEFSIPTGTRTTFWQWCADQKLTLADLDNGIMYCGTSVECECSELLADGDSVLTDEAADQLETFLERGEFSEFRITADGCAVFIG